MGDTISPPKRGLDKVRAGRIKAKETAPGGVCAPWSEGLDANEERLMTIVPDYPQADPLFYGGI